MGYSAQLLSLAQKLNQESPSQRSVSPPHSIVQPYPSVNIDYVSCVNVPRPLNTLVVREDVGIYELNEEVEVVDMKSGVCNHHDITSFDWDVCVKLKELRIGDRCLENVMAFVLRELKKLERGEIGCSCFTKAKGRMEVSGCGLLKSVKIGKDSCGKWSEFVMRDCGVEEVEIGDGCFADCENTVFEGEDVEGE